MQTVNISGLAFKCVMFVLTCTSEVDLHRVVMSGDKKRESESDNWAKLGPLAKSKWSLHCWMSLRGVGWN